MTWSHQWCDPCKWPIIESAYLEGGALLDEEVPAALGLAVLVLGLAGVGAAVAPNRKLAGNLNSHNLHYQVTLGMSYRPYRLQRHWLE